MWLETIEEMHYGGAVPTAQQLRRVEPYPKLGNALARGLHPLHRQHDYSLMVDLSLFGNIALHIQGPLKLYGDERLLVHTAKLSGDFFIKIS